MTIKEIAYKISDEALNKKRPVSKLQEIRYQYLKTRPNTWHIFSEKSVYENNKYAFHSGGRKEIQFNIGQDYIKNRNVFRYGLAFSLEKSQGLLYPVETFEVKIKRFNNFLNSNVDFFNGYYMWYWTKKGDFKFYENVAPIEKKLVKEGNFIFIGKYFNRDVEDITHNDIETILDSFDHLINAYKEIEFGKNQNEKRIARLTWNINGWVKPSGPEGKSDDKDTHEGKFGYGHEEWLMDTSKLVDGYHYGFLEPIRKEQQVYTGNTYDVWLYTIDGISKKRYWVGQINNVEVINNAEAVKIKEIYIENGWHKEMENQIVRCGAKAKGFSDWNGVDLFNVKFFPEDLNFNSDYYLLPKENDVYKQHRYTFAAYNKELTPAKVAAGFVFDSDNEEEEGENAEESKIATSTYDREPKAIEITYVHKAISDDLKIKFKSKFGAKNVKTEVRAGYGNNKIDLVVKDQESIVFYEIKSYNSSRVSIREALGQLLEYCSWTNKRNADKMVIVSQLLGDSEDAKVYIKHLRECLGLPIYFQTFDLTTKELSEEY